MQIYYFFFISFLINIQCFIVLSQSNTNTIILNPKINAITHAVAYPYQYFDPIAQAPNAINIYDGTDNTSCDHTMTIQSMFQIRCSVSTIYAYIAADEQYIAYLNGQVLYGSIQSMDNFTIDATNYQCGVDINLTIQVRNNVQCDNFDGLVLIYAIISEDCSNSSNNCSSNNNSQLCGYNCNNCISDSICLGCVFGYALNKENKCQSCNLTMIGCNRCLSNSSCLSCICGYYLDTHNYCKLCNQKMIGCNICLSDSYCLVCIDGYYFDQAIKICSSCGIGCLSCYDSFYCLNCNEDFDLNQQKYCQKKIKIQLINDSIKGIIVIFSILLTILIAICCLIYTRNRMMQAANQQIIVQPIINTQINSCSICLESECDLKTLCNHLFHSKCLSQWIKKAPQCPKCRKKNIGVVKVAMCIKCMQVHKDLELFKKNFPIEVEFWRRKIQEGGHLCEEKRYSQSTQQRL